MTRELLPARRLCKTIDTVAKDHLVTVTVGYYADGRPGEVFVSGLKTGQETDSIMRDAAVILSIALQHGTPLEIMAGAITRDPQNRPMSFVGALLDELIKEENEAGS